MSRWIDAEYCEDFFDKWESRVKNADPVTIDVVQNTRTLLRDAPSIDIVRCKECKHTYKWDSGCGAELVCKARRCDPSDWGNNRIEFYVKADDFCSYGERKESE